jgi:hypothetical protein
MLLFSPMIGAAIAGALLVRMSKLSAEFTEMNRKL